MYHVTKKLLKSEHCICFVYAILGLLHRKLEDNRHGTVTQKILNSKVTRK